MSHELVRLTSKLCNTPLLVTEAYLDKVLSILENRNSGNAQLAVVDNLAPRKRSLQYFPDRKLGVVDIHGGITDIPYYGMCGEEGVSHQAIREEVTQLIEAGAKTIVLDQDSNGGMAHTSFESANYIRNLADENDVKLISYISAASFSASYVYSAVAHEVISNPTAESGSIGVRVQLRNVNGYMRKMGIEDIYITAGEGKVPFDSEGKFTPEFLSEVQESVLEIYEDFTNHVAMWRGMDKEDVKKLGAKTFSSKKAVAKGLVDKTMTLEEFKSYLESVTLGGDMANPVTNLFKSKQKDKEMSVDVQELQASLDQLKLDYEASKESLEAVVSERDTLQAQLETALAELKVAAEEKKLAKVEARKAKLATVVGDEKAASLCTSLASLSDEDFEDTIKLMGGVVEAKEVEIGDQGEEVQAEELSREESIAVGMEQFLKKQNKKGK